MPRISLTNPEQLPTEVRGVLDRRANARGQGRVSEIFRLLANNPSLAVAFAEQNMKLYEALPLDPAVREAMVIRIANLLEAPYVRSAHIDIGRRAGLSEAQCLALETEGYRADALFKPEAVSLIDFAAAVVSSPNSLDDARCDTLIARYGENGFMAITMLCAQYASASIFTTVMQLHFSP